MLLLSLSVALGEHSRDILRTLIDDRFSTIVDILDATEASSRLSRGLSVYVYTVKPRFNATFGEFKFCEINRGGA